MSGCGAVGQRDRVWVEAAQDAGVMEKCESPHGKMDSHVFQQEQRRIASGR